MPQEAAALMTPDAGSRNVAWAGLAWHWLAGTHGSPCLRPKCQEGPILWLWELGMGAVYALRR